MSRTVARTLVTALLTVAAVLLPGTAHAADPRPAGPVVLLTTGGLRWDDVSDTTPALTAVLQEDAVAALSVRSVRDTTCPVDGALTVSAGRRAADAPPPTGGWCRTPDVRAGAEGTPATVTGWGTYRTEASAGAFDADPGLLAETLAAAGRTAAAVGPGAAVVTADRQGRTAHYWPGVPAGEQGTLDPGADALGLSQQATTAMRSGADLVVVDLGDVHDVGVATPTPQRGDGTDGTDTTDTSDLGPPSRQEQVAGLDTRLGLIMDDVPANATLLLASLADDGTGTHLQLLAARAPAAGGNGALGAGLLRSGSTRQDGLVQSTDLFPTILARLGVAVPGSAVGSPLTGVPGGAPLDRLQRVAEIDHASHLIDPLVTPFFTIAGVIELALLLSLGWAAHRGRRVPVARHRALTLLWLAAIPIALVPAATFLANLVPWWRSPLPGPTLALAVFAAVVVLSVVALAAPWRRLPLGPAGAAGAVTVGVLAADALTGSRLSLIALIGGQPLVAGRFYGFSNPTFAILGTSAVFAALALVVELRRRGRPPVQQALGVAAVGAVVTAVDALPGLGSDFGGPPALVPAFALLALWVAGVRVTWRRIGAIGLGTVAVLAAVSVLDWLRPAGDRSHLGRFVQTVLDGGAGDVVLRKAEQNLGMLVSSPLTLLVPPATIVFVLVLWRPARWYAPALDTAYRQEPLLRRGVAAIGVMLLLGFAVNDSGTSIPPAALLVLVPLLVAVTAQLVDRSELEAREAAAVAAARPARRR